MRVVLYMWNVEAGVVHSVADREKMLEIHGYSDQVKIPNLPNSVEMIADIANIRGFKIDTFNLSVIPNFIFP